MKFKFILISFLVIGLGLAVPDGSSCTTGADCDNWICVDTDGGLYPGNGVDTCNSSSTVTAGTLCDYNNSAAVEIIGSTGSCDLREENCSISYFYFDSESDTTQINLYSNITCQIGETALCNITIIDSDTTQTGYASNSTQLNSGHIILSPPIKYGTNLIRTNCSCTSTQSICEKYTQNNATISAQIINFEAQLPIGPNHDFNTTVSVRNLGFLGLDLNLTDNIFNSSNCNPLNESISYWWMNTSFHINSTGQIGDVHSFIFNRSTTCNNILEEYIHLITLNDTNLNLSVLETNFTGGCFAVRECYDYADPLIDPRYDCFICGETNKSLTDYSCVSNSYCCRTGEKFQNGVCCPESNTCCISSSDCSTDQYCDTNINSCVNMGTTGSSCLADGDCISDHCDNTYCCESITQLPEACEDSGGECKCCRLSSDCSATYYCDSYANQCISCSTDNEGVCDGAPSTNCVGTDPDCCDEDSECSSTQYCDDNSIVCRSCSTKSEQWCPSIRCIGIDPDCCDELNPCSFGNCNPSTNTCEIILGNTCSVNGDCLSGLCQHDRCTLKEFLILQPTALRVRIREKIFTTVTVLNYWDESIQVLLTVDSSVARFINRKNSILVNIEKGETRAIPLIVESSLPGNFIATVTAQDSTYSDVSTVKNMQILISGEDARQSLVTAPESLNLLLMLVLYAAGVWKILN